MINPINFKENLREEMLYKAGVDFEEIKIIVYLRKREEKLNLN